MKNVLYKSIAVCMSFVVMMTTTSFAIDMHYCGDTLVDLSLTKNVDICETDKAQLPMSCEAITSKKSCCFNERFVIDGQDNLKISFDTLSFDQQSFVIPLFFLYFQFFKTAHEKSVPFKDYHPPFIEHDFLALNQFFLI